MGEVKKFTPKEAFEGYPCSVTAVGTAMGLNTEREILSIMPDGLRKDGYLSLKGGNVFIRRYLRVQRYTSFKKGQRPTLGELLPCEGKKMIVLVLGHYVYAEGKYYYSFFDNINDEVVGVWWLKQ